MVAIEQGKEKVPLEDTERIHALEGLDKMLERAKKTPDKLVGILSHTDSKVFDEEIAPYLPDEVRQKLYTPLPKDLDLPGVIQEYGRRLLLAAPTVAEWDAERLYRVGIKSLEAYLASEHPESAIDVVIHFDLGASKRSEANKKIIEKRR